MSAYMALFVYVSIYLSMYGEHANEGHSLYLLPKMCTHRYFIRCFSLGVHIRRTDTCAYALQLSIQTSFSVTSRQHYIPVPCHCLDASVKSLNYVDE